METLSFRVVLTKKEWLAVAKTVKSPSKDSEGHCFYRRQDGARCFIGAAAPSEEAAMMWQDRGGTALHLFDLGYVGVSDVIADRQGEFLFDLQQIHDSYHPETWPQRFSAFEEKWNP